MPLSFPPFESHLRTLYAQGKLREIIAQIDEQRDDFPDERLFLAFWQLGMAARLDDPELAFQILDDLIDQGQWISQYLLQTSPSLENLQNNPEYEGRLQEMAILQQREISQLIPLLTLHQEGRCGTDITSACPLLIGLHAGRSLSLKAIPFWQVAATNGWLVGVPQSSQALWSGGYVWDDVQIARDEIEHHIQRLQAKYAIHPRRIILAGRGSGGELAALLPISGGIEARGFIALGPTGLLMDDPDQWARILQGRPPRGLRGVILVGEQDPYPPIAEIRRMVDLFNNNGLPTHLEILPNLGGDYTPDYDQAILKAIDFVLS